MYCPKCILDRPQSHTFCFACGSLLKVDHQNEVLPRIASAAGAEDQNAFQKIQKMANEKPESPVAQQVFGKTLFHKGRLIEAESRYRAALDIDPDNSSCAYDLAIVLYYQARLTEALQQLEKVLIMAPDYSPAYYRAGLICYHLGQYEAAIKYYKKCIALTPDFIIAHYQLGVVYARLGDVENAIKEFNYELEKNLADAACRHHLEELFVEKWAKEKTGDITPPKQQTRTL